MGVKKNQWQGYLLAEWSWSRGVSPREKAIALSGCPIQGIVIGTLALLTLISG